MKYSGFFIILCLFFSLHGFSQVTDADLEKKLKKNNIDTTYGWHNGGFLNLNFSQTSLSNWSAGGEESITINSMLNLFANYKKKKMAWDNVLDIGYGIVRQEEFKTFRKNNDLLELTSKYGRQAVKNWYFAGLINLKTQIQPGYDYPNDSVKLSDFLAPGYLLGAIGMDLKKNNRLSLFIAPLTLKTTIVSSQHLANQGAFGVDAAEYDQLGNIIKEGKRFRKETGGYIRMMYTKENIFKNVNLTTKFDAFSNYSNSPENIDINWETLITMKINKYFSATLNTLLIYDDEVDIEVDTNKDGVFDKKGPRVQFKEIFGLGFAYKFQPKS